MGRILAIDYGRKRSGLAVTDKERIIATALETVPTGKLIDFIQDYLISEKVDCFVVGLPVRLHDVAPEIEKDIHAFIKKLKQKFPEIPVDRYDERFTSKIAMQSMIDAGAKKSQRRDKFTLDKISATIILQSYMEHKKNTGLLS